jgi:hypothetical protein
MNNTPVKVIAGNHINKEGFADVLNSRNGRVRVYFKGVNVSGAYINLKDLEPVK